MSWKVWFNDFRLVAEEIKEKKLPLFELKYFVELICVCRIWRKKAKKFVVSVEKRSKRVKKKVLHDKRRANSKVFVHRSFIYHFCSRLMLDSLFWSANSEQRKVSSMSWSLSKVVCALKREKHSRLNISWFVAHLKQQQQQKEKQFQLPVHCVCARTFVGSEHKIGFWALRGKQQQQLGARSSRLHMDARINYYYLLFLFFGSTLTFFSNFDSTVGLSLRANSWLVCFTPIPPNALKASFSLFTFSRRRLSLRLDVELKFAWNRMCRANE